MKWFLSLLFAVLVTSSVDAQIVASAVDGPAMRPLPKYVQALDDEGYAAWAEWQNALARRASADRERFESPYLSGLRTVTSTGGSAYGDSYSRSDRRSNTRVSSHWRSANSISATTTVPIRVPNPDYVAKPLVIYNPYFRPTLGPKPLPGMRIEPYQGKLGTPDWDNLHCVLRGKICTVSEVLETLIVPVPAETLYEQLMQPFKFSTVERVPLD